MQKDILSQESTQLTMKNMLIASLLSLPKCQGSIKEIKGVMLRKFHHRL